MSSYIPGTQVSSRAARPGLLLAIAALVIVVIAACDGTSSSGAAARSEPAGQVIANVHRAVADARSVHLTGQERRGSTLVTLDVSFSGHEVAGTVGENGTTFDVLALGSNVYVKVDPSVLQLAQLPASLCTHFCGHFVELPASTVEKLTGNVSLSSVTAEAFSGALASQAKKPGAKFEPATVGGKPVLRYSSKGYTLAVARTGPAYPVLYTAPDGSHITFSDWNSVRLPGPPPASQVVSLSQL
jgi:hypothetical protein